MASFEAKIGCQRPQKRENKNYRSVPFRSNPTHKRKPHKNRKKIQKINKQRYGIILSQYRSEKAEKERKQKLSIHSIPTRHVTENSKKIAKRFKKLQKYNYSFISSQNRLEKAKKKKK